MSLLFALITFLVLSTAAGLALIGILRNKPAQVIWAGAAASAWSALYLAMLILVSLSSSERILDLNEHKHFCGFYLDCHGIVSVLDVQTSDWLGPEGSPVEANGIYYVVTVRQSSDAKRVPIAVSNPLAVVIDSDGVRYHRSVRGERALALSEGPLPPLGHAVEAGGGYATKLVFDLPRDVKDPRLNITENHWLTRLSEILLIGDDDSLLHKPTTFRLTT